MYRCWIIAICIILWTSGAWAQPSPPVFGFLCGSIVYPNESFGSYQPPNGGQGCFASTANPASGNAPTPAGNVCSAKVRLLAIIVGC